MTTSVKEFVERLISSGLMSRAEVDEMLAGLAKDDPPADGDELSDKLLKQNRLTDYQLRALRDQTGDNLVFGNYVVLDQIGRGGMGVVFKAQHRQMKRVVALKLISPKWLRDEDALRRFQREIEMVGRLQHPNIAMGFDAGEENGMLYCVMEYVDGRTLSEIVQEDGPLPLTQAVDYVMQAAQALAAAHREGIIHRDVKPSNLLVDKRGRVKILDLGIARVAQNFPIDAEAITVTELTDSMHMVGTADYMSPEQAVQTSQADHRSDIYSLGCTLFFLLTGRHVYEGDSVMAKLLAHRENPIPQLTTFRPDTPEHLEIVFRRMVAKHAADRQQSMTDVADELETVRRSIDGTKVYLGPRHLTTSEPETTGSDRASARRRGKRPWNSVAGAAMLLVVVVAVAWLTYALTVGEGQGRDGGPPDRSLTTNGETTPQTNGHDAGDEFQFALQHVFVDLSGRVKSVAFTPDGKSLVAAGGSGPNAGTPAFISLHDLATGQVQRTFDEHNDVVQCVAISRDGDYLLSGGGPGDVKPGSDCTVRLWDLRTGTQLHRFDAHTDQVRSVAFSPDGRRGASASIDRTIQVYSLADRKELGPRGDSSHEVLSVVFSDDGQMILSGTLHRAELWRIDTNDLVQVFSGHNGPVLCAVFSRDGDRVATAGDDKTIRIYAVDSGDELKSFDGHRDRVTCVRFVGNDAYLVSSGRDGTVCLWDVESTKQLDVYPIEGAAKPVNCVAVGPDGTQLLSASEDSTVTWLSLTPDAR